MEQLRFARIGALCLGATLVTATGFGLSAAWLQDAEGDSAGSYQTLEVGSASELEGLYQSLGYQWPPVSGGTIPPLALKSLPVDVDSLTDVTLKKTLFLRTLLPIALIENRKIHEKRALVEFMLAGDLPGATTPTGRWLSQVAADYDVTGDLNDPDNRRALLDRIDEVPADLVLAQAAIESGWGTSRFATEGNNLFGQWTLTSSAGIEPDARAPDATHFVRAYPSLLSSVRSYMRNLNTSRAYREFRAARAQMRSTGQTLQAYELAASLQRYSERGQDYVTQLRSILRSDTFAPLRSQGLQRIDQAMNSVRLAPAI